MVVPVEPGLVGSGVPVVVPVVAWLVLPVAVLAVPLFAVLVLLVPAAVLLLVAVVVSAVVVAAVVLVGAAVVLAVVVVGVVAALTSVVALFNSISLNSLCLTRASKQTNGHCREHQVIFAEQAAFLFLLFHNLKFFLKKIICLLLKNI